MSCEKCNGRGVYFNPGFIAIKCDRCEDVKTPVVAEIKSEIEPIIAEVFGYKIARREKENLAKSENIVIDDDVTIKKRGRPKLIR
jgi:hypothetical protein